MSIGPKASGPTQPVKQRHSKSPKFPLRTTGSHEQRVTCRQWPREFDTHTPPASWLRWPDWPTPCANRVLSVPWCLLRRRQGESGLYRRQLVCTREGSSAKRKQQDRPAQRRRNSCSPGCEPGAVDLHPSAYGLHSRPPTSGGWTGSSLPAWRASSGLRSRLRMRFRERCFGSLESATSSLKPCAADADLWPTRPRRPYLRHEGPEDSWQALALLGEAAQVPDG